MFNRIRAENFLCSTSPAMNREMTPYRSFALKCIPEEKHPLSTLSSLILPANCLNKV
jgi:hypothetical protein